MDEHDEGAEEVGVDDLMEVNFLLVGFGVDCPVLCLEAEFLGSVLKNL